MAVVVSAYHPVTVIVSEDDRPLRPHGIDWSIDRPIAIPVIAVRTVGARILQEIATHLVRRVNLIGSSEDRSRHRELGKDSANTEKCRLHPAIGNIISAKVAGIV